MNQEDMYVLWMQFGKQSTYISLELDLTLGFYMEIGLNPIINHFCSKKILYIPRLMLSQKV